MKVAVAWILGNLPDEQSKHIFIVDERSLSGLIDILYGAGYMRSRIDTEDAEELAKKLED